MKFRNNNDTSRLKTTKIKTKFVKIINYLNLN